MKLLPILCTASVAMFCASLIVTFVSLMTIATPELFAHGATVALVAGIVAAVSCVSMVVTHKMHCDRIYKEMARKAKI